MNTKVFEMTCFPTAVISREARPRNLLTGSICYPVASRNQYYAFVRDFSTFQVSGSEGMNTKVFEMTCFPTTVISREARPRNLLTGSICYPVASGNQYNAFVRDFSTFQVSSSEGTNPKVFEMTDEIVTLI